MYGYIKDIIGNDLYLKLKVDGKNYIYVLTQALEREHLKKYKYEMGDKVTFKPIQKYRDEASNKHVMWVTDFEIYKINDEEIKRAQEKRN